MTMALDIVKEVYSRFGEGDMDGFLNLCADDIEWVVNGPAALEKCKAFRGREGVQEFLNILGESWEFSSFTPREFISDGQTVVVLGEESGKGCAGRRLDRAPLPPSPTADRRPR